MEHAHKSGGPWEVTRLPWKGHGDQERVLKTGRNQMSSLPTRREGGGTGELRAGQPHLHHGKAMEQGILETISRDMEKEVVQ